MILSKTLNSFEAVKQNFILEEFLPIPEHTVAMIASRGGRGKTFLSLQCAIKYSQHGKKCAVWFTEDDGDTVKERAQELHTNGIVKDLSPLKNIEFITTEPPQLAYADGRLFKANYDAFKEIRMWCIANDIKFIIIDPLLVFYGGNENDNSQARVFMQPFIEWAKQDKITILIVHHANKGTNETRGAGAFVDAVRTLYELELPIDTDTKGNQTVNDELYEKGVRRIKLVKDNRNAKRPLWKKYQSDTFDLRVLPPIKKHREIQFEEVTYAMPVI